MNGRVLGSVVEQGDLGVSVHSSLKVVSQVHRVVNMGFCALAFISQGMEEVMLHKAVFGVLCFSFGRSAIERLLSWKECREDL